MHKIQKIKFLKIFFIFVFSSSALAFEWEGPLAKALSGAGRAVTQKGAEYHLLNPASLAQDQGFKGQGFYGFKTKESPAFWGLSLMENSELPVALSYIREIKEEAGGDQYLSFSIAGFVLPGWSLGLSLSRGEAGESANWNIQAGILIKPPQSLFSLGAVWDHILPLEGAFKEKRKWGFGLAYEPYEWISLRADALYNPLKKWKIVGGGVFTISRVLILRGGSSWDFTTQEFLFSGGIGLSAKKIALDYGLSHINQNHINQNQREKLWLHTLNVRGGF